jgi:hypothetical protein
MIAAIVETEAPMNSIINFFALQPIFTFFSIRMVWYIYLLNAVIQAYVAINGIVQVMAQRGISWETWSPSLLPLILGIVAQVALVRLLLEVAATILLTPRGGRQASPYDQA